MTPTIGIFSIKEDPHAREVEILLKKKGSKVFRFNSDHISAKNNWTFDPNRSNPYEFSGTNSLRLSEFSSLWYRKPDLWLTEYSKLTYRQAMALDFKFQETIHLYKSLFYEAEIQNIFIVGKLSSLVSARNKPLQLKNAKNLGFLIPDTLITSSTKDIKYFIAYHGGEVIVKPMDAGYVRFGAKEKSLFTYRLTSRQFADFVRKKTSLDYPLLIQEKIPKKLELRITVIGKQLFACAIDSQSNPSSLIDMRKVDPYTIPHSIIELPQEIKDLCFALCRLYDLQFGAIDMALTPDGRYVFFEINANGQYLWIEYITGLPLSQAMADLLNDPSQFSLSRLPSPDI